MNFVTHLLIELLGSQPRPRKYKNGVPILYGFHSHFVQESFSSYRLWQVFREGGQQSPSGYYVAYFEGFTAMWRTSRTEIEIARAARALALTSMTCRTWSIWTSSNCASSYFALLWYEISFVSSRRILRVAFWLSIRSQPRWLNWWLVFAVPIQAWEDGFIFHSIIGTSHRERERVRNECVFGETNRIQSLATLSSILLWFPRCASWWISEEHFHLKVIVPYQFLFFLKKRKNIRHSFYFLITQILISKKGNKKSF